MKRLCKRSDFLAAARGRRLDREWFALEAALRPVTVGEINNDTTGEARFGFTVTKKVGNAVVRNRIRRRLKEAVRLAAGEHADRLADFVVIGKPAALKASFGSLKTDLGEAVKRVLTAGRIGRRRSDRAKPPG